MQDVLQFIVTFLHRSRLVVAGSLLGAFWICDSRAFCYDHQDDPFHNGLKLFTINFKLTNSFGSYYKHQDSPESKQNKIKFFCNKVRKKFYQFGWKEDPCGDVTWEFTNLTASNNPLIYTVFGTGENTTLLFSGVHPDEYTPIPMAFRFAKNLHKNQHIYSNSNIRVIVVPLLNPDGFLKPKPNRTNSNGVDINRNFLTHDWYQKAAKLWKNRRRANPRYFPGFLPNSEIETLFQVELIKEFQPDKILTIHAPLGFLDYDGPGDQQKLSKTLLEKQAKVWVQKVSEKSRDYKIVDYSFYPGSLGNFAGNERRIPTVTLELESTDTRKVEQYWSQFLPGMLQAIQLPIDTKFSPEDIIITGSYTPPKHPEKS